jgi:hypothetical protein
LTKEQIVSAILAVAGDPASGIIKELAPAFADAILAIDAPKVEKRVVEATEKR